MAALLNDLFTIEQDFVPNTAAQQRGLAMLMDHPSYAHIFVADVQGSVVGMCVLHIRISTALGGWAGVVEDVIVNPSYRGQGIGTRLLDAAAAHARERGMIRLHLLMDRDNTAAHQFYRARGWKGTQLVCLTKNLLPDATSGHRSDAVP